MKNTTLLVICSAASILMTSCDMRSGIARQEAEKFTSSPTPTIASMPTPTPVDAADVVEVDTSIESAGLSIEGYKEKKSASCTKFERVRVNGDGNEITIKGPCRQVMINGDTNNIKIDSAGEIVFNGAGNALQYSRFVNGKQPIIVENRPDNVVEQVSGGTMTNQKSKRNIVK